MKACTLTCWLGFSTLRQFRTLWLGNGVTQSDNSELNQDTQPTDMPKGQSNVDSHPYCDYSLQVILECAK